jgi:hypothetical protein
MMSQERCMQKDEMIQSNRLLGWPAMIGESFRS